MKLVLARHGNTFRSDEPAYYVGSQEDLPLVDHGVIQATQIGRALAKQHGHLSAVYTGPLQRMQATAHHALQALTSELVPVIDQRLNELDYGLWSGLTSQAVRERFGDADYERWERESLWPDRGMWGESEQAVIARITAFATDLVHHHAAEDTILVVASNGCLRYFLHLVPGAFAEKVAERRLKIGTGHLCELRYSAGVWSLVSWNQAPT